MKDIAREVINRMLAREKSAGDCAYEKGLNRLILSGQDVLTLLNT